MTPAAIAAGLLDASLPQSEWTHRGHIAAAHALVLAHGHEGALDRLRVAIPRLNEAHGVANDDHGGYHETLTVFFAAAVADAVRRGRTVNGTVDDVPSDAALRWWTEPVLMAPSARHGWVPPDVAAPPFALLP